MGTKKDRLEQVRAELGLNKTEMAEKMGITQSYYQHIIADKGKANLRLEHLEQLLMSAGVNPLWVLSGEEEMFVGNSHKIEWEKEPTQEQIDELYKFVMKNDATELSAIQKLKFQLACAQCYYDYPDVRSLKELAIAARVYLKIIVRYPQFDLGGLL